MKLASWRRNPHEDTICRLTSYSAPILYKIELLKSHGVDLSKEIIEEAVRFPDKIEKGYGNRLVAQKRIDDTHVLRVVFETTGGVNLVITVYPGRRARYEKD